MAGIPPPLPTALGGVNNVLGDFSAFPAPTRGPSRIGAARSPSRRKITVNATHAARHKKTGTKATHRKTPKGIHGFELAGHGREAGDRNAIYFFIIAVLSAFCVGVQNYLFASAAATSSTRLRQLSFKAILRQDIEFFDKDENSTCGLTATLSDNPQKVNGLAGITLGAIVQSCSLLVTGAIIGLAIVWQLGLVGIACTPFLVSAGYIRLRVVVLKDQRNKKAHEASAQLACETAGAIRTVASLTREDDCCDLYSKSLVAPLRQSNRTAIWSNLLYSASQSMMFFVIALVFWFRALLVSRRQVSTFQFFVGLMCSTFPRCRLGICSPSYPDMSSAKGAASDIIKLLDSVPEVDAESPAGGKVDVATARGHIRLEGIHFHYPTRPGVRVLRGLSIECEPGKYIALVGASGCGKSTVCLGVFKLQCLIASETSTCFPSIREVRCAELSSMQFDGQSITELYVQEYRKQIALVSQEPTLYAGTVRFNILDAKDIEAACRDANVLGFIRSLPDGFDTDVGGKGFQLSGGQKLAKVPVAYYFCARTDCDRTGTIILRNPKLLLLDEVTSALDSNSEKVVQAALDQAAKGRTTIASAHRLSTIQNADRIYFIKEGRVSECGTHDQLLARRGDYYEYVQLQALSKRD
ncbi:P-loop containing nucleoside triphosphate hydrolase protein [Mycena pura]|uniref:P-loop containing nucleoside triphosphate hydrolase protein n=1 Tax=Mycena pura TaxID=153505 RepID=A0AAD6UYL1_9AGAR|nr:P-loop containing nucleoside triphosphate hydrolase protein [Mycena pura]